MQRDNALPPVQLRLGFASPSSAVTLHLVLAGLSVLVETSPDQVDETWTYLSEAGANPTMSEGRGLAFPVAALPALSDLPPQVRVVADEALTPLYRLVRNPSAEGKPAELTVDRRGSLWLNWYDGFTNHSEHLPPAAAVALLTADLPFVATTEAFDVLRSSSRLPLLVGRARVNLDGYVEITTSKPQLVESAPLPGLFRIDETHFGLALPYAPALDSAPGFVWEGHKPVVERGPADLPPLPMPLSRHAASDLRSLVDHLAAYRAQAVVWESGLGRRVFVLAAVEALDAWPLLIVTPPAHVWAWQRHLEMFGRTAALTHDDADAHIVTYADLARRADVSSPQAIVFDDLGSVASSPALQSALHRLDGLLDAYRILVDSTWPNDPASAVELMSVLRPGEFRVDVPVVARYPAHTEQRVAEHVACYLSERRVNDPGTDRTEFRSSGVVTLQPTQAQLTALNEAASRHAGGSAAALLSESLEIISAGPTLSLSPKIAAVTARAQEAVEDGRRVAVVTRHRRTETLIKATLRQLTALSCDAAADPDAAPPQGRLVVVRFDRDLPDLRWFDEVIVVDYPWSTEVIESAVGASSDEAGPLRVTVLHLAGTLDDRLAMLAARRRELGVVVDHTAAPTADEIGYLLTPRSC